MNGQRLLFWAFLSSFAVLLSATAVEDRLFPCPDCGEKVSRRAVSCPHCGCPGEAIHEAVHQSEEAKRPKRIAQVAADQRSGVAVLVKENEARYLVMDVSLMAGTESLVISELESESAIAYSHPELASDAPLLRFTVTGKAHVDYMQMTAGPTPVSSAAFITKTDQFVHAGEQRGEADSIAALDDSGSLLAVKAGDEWFPVHRRLEWIAVRPSDIRSQLDLLARAGPAAKDDELSPTDAATLRETEWLTPYLRENASEILRSNQKARTQ